MGRLILIGTAVVIVGYSIWVQVTTQTDIPAVEQFRDQYGRVQVLNLTKVQDIPEVRAIAVDTANPRKVYLATREGLVVMKDDEDLFRIGRSMGDLVSFTVHPKQSRTFYASIYTAATGHSILHLSRNAGVTWRPVSGVAGKTMPMSTLAVSRPLPSLLYGATGDRLYRSEDSGTTWEEFKTTFSFAHLAAHPQDNSVVYAATLMQGLQSSTDRGQSWTSHSQPLNGSSVGALAIHPQDPNQWLTVSDRLGLARSTDGGKTWTKIENPPGSIIAVTYDPKTPANVYSISKERSLFKSLDSGVTWKKIR